MTPLTWAAPPAVLCALALAACSAPQPSALTARPWHAAMTVTPGHCGRIARGQRGLEYRFVNHGDQAAAPVVSVNFTSETAPDGDGIAGEGQTAVLVLAEPGQQGTGTVLAPAGVSFGACLITSWQVAAVEARA